MKKRKRIQSLHANVFDKNAEKKARTHTHTHVDPCNATDILINYFHRKFP